jgi:hypothetical protein
MSDTLRAADIARQFQIDGDLINAAANRLPKNSI